MKACQKKTVLVAVAAMLVFLLFGCKKGTPEEEQSDGADTLGSEQVQGEKFEDVLSLWESGDKEGAVAGFFKINWQSPNVFSNTPIFSLSEREFTKMPASKRNETANKAMELTRTSRQLVLHVLELGRASLETKDYDTAESRFNAVLEYGSILWRSEGLEIMKMHGRAIHGAALKKLITLYTETNDQVKLKAAKEKLSQL